ncbi:hypothetical protein R3P38DRAFT_3219550 [Favolaschia claudopus]|uniref:Uncharacterized protein n=1 Tax=Favolaschia claudopus TaxID=2862362 RepID=A0AAW0A295_9AGAR
MTDSPTRPCLLIPSLPDVPPPSPYSHLSTIFTSALGTCCGSFSIPPHFRFAAYRIRYLALKSTVIRSAPSRPIPPPPLTTPSTLPNLALPAFRLLSAVLLLSPRHRIE